MTAPDVKPQQSISLAMSLDYADDYSSSVQWERLRTITGKMYTMRNQNAYRR